MKIKSVLFIAAALTCLLCVWFAGIACLNAFRQILLDPQLDRLEYEIHELSLKETPPSADDVYLMGLRMKSSPEGLTPQYSRPLFKDHKLDTVSIFLFRGDIKAGNLLVSVFPDKLGNTCNFATPFQASKILNTILFLGDSNYSIIDRIHKAKSSDFSRWNFVYDVRLVYILFMKACGTPYWYTQGRVYHVESPGFSGYLAEGKYSKNRNIKELTFAKDGVMYQVIIVDRSGSDFREFMSSIRVAGEKQADEIINGYPRHKIPRNLVLISRISRKPTVADLDELIGLIEKRKASGKKTFGNTDPLKAELEYLKRH